MLSRPSGVLKKSQSSARQGKSERKSGVYTPVHEHLTGLASQLTFNAVSCRRRIFQHAAGVLTSLLAMVLISACASQAPVPGEGQVLHKKPVFYGTNRNRQPASDTRKIYGGTRGEFETGIAEVTFVASRTSSSNARGHNDFGKPVLTSVETLSSDLYFSELQEQLGKAGENTLLVFVHGYYRSFARAAETAAEFTARVNFKGVPVIWSWPSSRTPQGYLEDETNIFWSRPQFAQFLKDHLQRSGADTVHLVGHSLGAKALTLTLVEDLLPDDSINPDNIGELVLLAPDIDAEIFTRDFAPRLANRGISVTLYQSANDRAMATSKALHGYTRAGDSSSGTLLAAGITTIDVTAENDSLLGHSYYDRSDAVTQDLGKLLNQRKPAGQRDNLLRIDTPQGNWWKLELE